MNTLDVKRKLMAILSADVEGYSRLMGKDELGTIRTLTAYRDTMTNLNGVLNLTPDKVKKLNEWARKTV